MDWIEQRIGRDALTAVGHRVVHGGSKYSEPQRITAEMVEELHRLSPFDPEHLPEEILLTVRIIRTDEELVIAEAVCRTLDLKVERGKGA